MTRFHYDPNIRYCCECLHSHYAEHEGRTCLYCRQKRQVMDLHTAGCKSFTQNCGAAFALALQQWRRKNHH